MRRLSRIAARLTLAGCLLLPTACSPSAPPVQQPHNVVAASCQLPDQQLQRMQTRNFVTNINLNVDRMQLHQLNNPFRYEQRVSLLDPADDTTVVFVPSPGDGRSPCGFTVRYSLPRSSVWTKVLFRQANGQPSPPPSPGSACYSQRVPDYTVEYDRPLHPGGARIVVTTWCDLIIPVK